MLINMAITISQSRLNRKRLDSTMDLDELGFTDSNGQLSSTRSRHISTNHETTPTAKMKVPKWYLRLVACMAKNNFPPR